MRLARQPAPSTRPPASWVRPGRHGYRSLRHTGLGRQVRRHITSQHIRRERRGNVGRRGDHFARPASLARHRQRIHRRGPPSAAAPRTRRQAAAPSAARRASWASRSSAQLLPPDPFGRHFHSHRLHSVRGASRSASRAEAPLYPSSLAIRSCASLVRRSRIAVCASVSARSARSVATACDRIVCRAASSWFEAVGTCQPPPRAYAAAAPR